MQPRRLIVRFLRRVAAARRGATTIEFAFLMALFFLPIIPGAAWKPPSPAEPAWRILQLLFACVGLPYFVLSTTGPLMQEWFRRLKPGASPYVAPFMTADHG